MKRVVEVGDREFAIARRAAGTRKRARCCSVPARRDRREVQGTRRAIHLSRKSGTVRRLCVAWQKMKFLRALFSGLLVTTAAQAGAPPMKSAAEMMREMRIGWLTRVPEHGGYQRQDEVVTVLMDWPLGEQIVTVLSSSAGDASLYTMGTFGIIGGIGHENVRKAAAAYVACAQRHLEVATPTTDYAYPGNRIVRFFMVTPSGVRAVSFPLREVERAGTPAHELFAAGQRVVTELRLIAPHQK
jgi:hypothetical protein